MILDVHLGSPICTLIFFVPQKTRVVYLKHKYFSIFFSFNLKVSVAVYVYVYAACI